MVSVRDNWRVFLLVLVLLGSTFALFSPTMSGSDGPSGPGQASDGPTNLRFGLELSGGTRIRAPLVGVTAEGVQFGDENITAVERNVADQFDGITVTDVTARRSANASTVEVTAENVTTDDLASALDATGYQYESVREGVTEPTRQQTVEVLQAKVNEAGLSGGTVQSVSTAQGQYFILIEAPEERQAVIDLVNSRGTVRVDIYHPAENGSGYTTREAVLEQGDFQSISTAQQGEGNQPPFVRVSIKENVAPQFQRAVVETGVAQPGGTSCSYRENPDTTDPCLLTKVDGEVVYAAGMEASLAQSMRSGQWLNDPTFILPADNYSAAQQLAIDLRAGALPAQLDLEEEGTSSYVSPSQGASFKVDSLITGVIAVLAVSVVVFLRYGRVEVAVPMILTALSEVVVLLGFASVIGYPIDLAVIAGFVAVIGTGVDDLIIIADEVMSEGDVSSRRVFQSRFRKAFWVIGAAAATTIIAMSPLAVLSLGDLRGFAIFTILGVIVGVLLTRPAYGDILRGLLTESR
ncbi:preprotein translocase subunit SecD [Halobium salinum]|uniref:Protein-export membrane protein SecD n=1 Tax=Halobium salinum TaxID=1364940 RepID=A0ABD5P879_9EURY|nr:preprotein translocase subunit SecD [Halobium salinum]